MPTASELFPSRYLKAVDLQGRQVTVTIDKVVQEDFGDDGEKPCAYFVGKDKGLVLNVTNFTAIAEISGKDNSDDWHGVRITLFSTKVQYKGKTSDGIRVMAPAMERTVKQAPKPAEPVATEGDTEEVVPF